MVHSFFRPVARPGCIGVRLRSLTAVALLALGGCASVPPPDGAMNAAQAELQAAREADAADYAPVDLGFAQNKFQQAQAAMVARDYEDAANLATEARADAELALAKARLGQARALVQQKLDENTRLRERMDRAHPELSGQAPALPQTLPGALPAAAPTPDTLPAPSASVLQPPLPSDGAGQGGFQTIPQPATSAPAGTPEGDQP